MEVRDSLTAKDWWNGKHDSGSPALPRRRRPLQSLLLKGGWLSQGRPIRVLELGCAPGVTMAMMHQVAPHNAYHGLDYSGVGILKARELLARMGVEADLRHEDMWESSFPPGSFDLVTSFGLVEHFRDPGPVVQRHLYFVKPGGTVLATVPNLASPRLKRWLCEKCDPDIFRRCNVAIMEPEALARTLKNVGLTETRAGRFGPGTFRILRLRNARVDWLYFLCVLVRLMNLVLSRLPVSIPGAENIVYATGRRAGGDGPVS